MSEWVTLFSGDESAAESLAKYLHERGVRSLKSFDEGATRNHSNKRVAVAILKVDSDILTEATRHLQDWSRPQADRANAITRKFLGILGVSLILPGLWLLLAELELEGVPYPSTSWLFGLWFVVLVVVGQIEDRRSRSETIGRTVQ